MLRKTTIPSLTKASSFPPPRTNAAALPCGWGDHIDVRDTKDLNSPTLTFNKDEWKAFVDGVKNGEFDT